MDAEISDTDYELASNRQNLEHSSPGSSSPDEEIEIQRNKKGKPVVHCPKCNKLCEKQTGLRMHLLYCKNKN